MKGHGTGLAGPSVTVNIVEVPLQVVHPLEHLERPRLRSPPVFLSSRFLYFTPRRDDEYRTARHYSRPPGTGLRPPSSVSSPADESSPGSDGRS